MISNLCLSCGDDLDWPSGDGCANMTAHKSYNKPWEMLVTDVEPDKTGWLLKYRRRQNVALREQISKEMTNMSLSDLRAVLRMIETWKGRGNE